MKLSQETFRLYHLFFSFFHFHGNKLVLKSILKVKGQKNYFWKHLIEGLVESLAMFQKIRLIISNGNE